MQEGMPCAQLGIRYLQKCMNKINMFQKGKKFELQADRIASNGANTAAFASSTVL